METRNWKSMEIWKYRILDFEQSNYTGKIRRVKSRQQRAEFHFHFTPIHHPPASSGFKFPGRLRANTSVTKAKEVLTIAIVISHRRIARLVEDPLSACGFQSLSCEGGITSSRSFQILCSEIDASKGEGNITLRESSTQ